MIELFILIKRNIKLFFKDKGLFLSAMITPAILLLLYSTFLGKVFNEAFSESIPKIPGLIIEQDLIDSFISGQLVSSLLAVSCVTVAFSTNAIMISDRFTKALKDFLVTPVSRAKLSLSYYFGALISTLIVLYSALALCLGYMGIVGFYLKGSDVGWIILDVLLLCNFGVALSSVIHFFLSTQGQMSAVGAIVSACYGFICGAYMPMSNFGEGLQKTLSFLPGTYATSLLRLHTMKSTLLEFGYPDEVNQSILKNVDARMFFFGNEVGVGTEYLILIGSTLILIGIYVLLNTLRKRANG